MTRENTNFPEIKTEYKYFTVRFEDKKIKLVYEIRQYSLVPVNKEASLRRNGVKFRKSGIKRDDGTVLTAFYKPYSAKMTTLKSRQRAIDKVLEMKVGDDPVCTLEEHINEVWDSRNSHKLSSTPLMDREANLLDALACYYMGGIEGDGILTRDLSRSIKSKEIVSISSMIKAENGEPEPGCESLEKSWEVRIMDKEKHEKLMKKPLVRWSKSRMNKHNLLYSYDNHKDEAEYYDWSDRKIKKFESPDSHYKIDRLINPEDEYVAEWCLVDTEGVFSFQDEKLKICDSFKQYQIGKLGRREYYHMDKILVMEQYGKRYYFDENIDPMQNEKINMVNV